MHVHMYALFYNGKNTFMYNFKVYKLYNSPNLDKRSTLHGYSLAVEFSQNFPANFMSYNLEIPLMISFHAIVAGTGEKSFSKLPFLSVHIRDVPDTTLPDTG